MINKFQQHRKPAGGRLALMVKHKQLLCAALLRKTALRPIFLPSDSDREYAAVNDNFAVVLRKQRLIDRGEWTFTAIMPRE